MKVIASRKVDELGRLVLPQELLSKYDIVTGESLDICVDGGGQIVLRKSADICRICGATENLHEITGKNMYICTFCQKEIVNA